MKSALTGAMIMCKNERKVWPLGPLGLFVDNFMQKFGFIKRVDKGRITTVKDLES